MRTRGGFIGIFIYLLFSAEGDWAAHDKLHLNIKCKGSYNASNTFTVSSALCHLSNPWAPILGGWMSGWEPHSALYDYTGLHLHNVSFENIHINKCTQYILVAMSLTFFFFFFSLNFGTWGCRRQRFVYVHIRTSNFFCFLENSLPGFIKQCITLKMHAENFKRTKELKKILFPWYSGELLLKIPVLSFRASLRIEIWV